MCIKAQTSNLEMVVCCMKHASIFWRSDVVHTACMVIRAIILCLFRTSDGCYDSNDSGRGVRVLEMSEATRTVSDHSDRSFFSIALRKNV